MQFPFPGKNEEDSGRIISNKWDYSKPLLLRPKDGFLPLEESDISNIRMDPNVRLEQLPDGRVFSLTKEATAVLFEKGYIVDVSYIGGFWFDYIF